MTSAVSRDCGSARGGHQGVGDFDIPRGVLAAEPDGVDRNALAPYGRHGFAIDAAGVIRAVAHQDDGAQGQGRGFRQHALQSIPDARGGRGTAVSWPVF